MHPDDATPSSPFDSYQRIRPRAPVAQHVPRQLIAAYLSDESAASGHNCATTSHDSADSKKNNKKRKRPSGAQKRKTKMAEMNRVPTTAAAVSQHRNEARIQRLGPSFLHFIQVRTLPSAQLSSHASG